MIYKSFNKYCEVHTNKIMASLEINIESLNLPKFVADRLIEVITDCEGEIMEYNFEQMIGDFEDRSYDEFKDTRLNIN